MRQMSLKVVSLLFVLDSGERRGCLGHANRRRCQPGEVEERSRELTALEHQLGSSVRVEFMLRSDADELREARRDRSNHSHRDRVPGVLQHDSIAFLAVSERSSAVLEVSRSLRSMPHLSRPLQRRAMPISRAGDNEKNHFDDNHHLSLLLHVFRFTRHSSRRSISKPGRRERFVSESSAPKLAGRKRSRKTNRLSHRINHTRIRKSFWQKLWARRRRWRA